MPSSPPSFSGIRDNHSRGTVADFLTEKIRDGSKLSIVSTAGVEGATLNAPSHPIRNCLLRLTAHSPDLLAMIKQEVKI